MDKLITFIVKIAGYNVAEIVKSNGEKIWILTLAFYPPESNSAISTDFCLFEGYLITSFIKNNQTETSHAALANKLDQHIKLLSEEKITLKIANKDWYLYGTK